MNLKTITISEYLTEKGIPFRESGKELVTKCVFGDCDRDNAENKGHLYFNKETGQYQCKKCGEQGNLLTLAKHFGDTKKKETPKRNPSFDPGLVEKCHQNLPQPIRDYLNNRGISDAVIDEYKLGYGYFYGGNYITIPIKGENGYEYFKLRQNPADGKQKFTFPKGASKATIFGSFDTKKLLISEGEMDAMALMSRGINAISSTHGAGTFKQEWIDERFKGYESIHVCYDNDKAGREGAEKVLKMLNKAGVKNLYNVIMSEEVGPGGDITDYLTKLNLPAEDLFTKYAKEYPEHIDVSQFKPITPKEIGEVLDLTIKNDYENKVVTFLCLISAYTENNQFNISFNSPSSTGKSYIALEVSKLFPNDDVMKLGNCSKTAFFHENGLYNKDTNEIIVDLSRKIMIFTDMPHTGLLEALRSFLSHDEKIMYSKITDKNQNGGNRTKTVALIGYCAFVYCSAGLRMDAQEQTRFILLSPEIGQEKIKAGISNTIRKEADNEKYRAEIEGNEPRKLLKLRIQAIKNEQIDEIKIVNEDKIRERFFAEREKLQPRHQRDIKRLISIIKALALINLWWRDRVGSSIIANDEDIEAAFELWEKISVCQDLNIPPYIYELYTQVLVPMWMELNAFHSKLLSNVKKTPLSRQDVLDKHYKVYKRPLDPQQLRQQIIPILETAGLIFQEPDPNDKRRMLIFLSPEIGLAKEEQYSGDGSGVDAPAAMSTSEAEVVFNEF
jgi:hypothetical protein